MGTAAPTQHLTRPAARAAGAALAALAAVALAGCTPAASRSSSSSSSSRQTVTTSGEAVVVVQAADDACWTATIDGRKHSGCGDATFSDKAGGAGATVVKRSGPGRVGVRLVVGDRTVDRGSVWRSRRSATVESG